jgi:hypothetical protein
MASNPPMHRREPDEEPGVDVSRLLVLAFAVAAIIGLGTGIAWVGWNLIRIHVLGWGA